MMHRNLVLGALLLIFAAGFGFSAAAMAETIAVDDSIAVKEPGVPSPTRGMSMQQVESKFGAPSAKSQAVGQPPITRWDYSGFAVYFEYDHVIHSVALSS